MSSGSRYLAQLHPYMADAVRYLLEYCDSQGVEVAVVSGFRSMEEQAQLYALGRTSRQIRAHTKLHGTHGSVTDAPPGYSPHNYGLAVDLESDQLALVKSWARIIGFQTVSWDAPHIEYPGWRKAVGL